MRREVLNPIFAENVSRASVFLWDELARDWLSRRWATDRVDSHAMTSLREFRSDPVAMEMIVPIKMSPRGIFVVLETGRRETIFVVKRGAWAN